MAVTQADICQVQEKIRPLLGKKPWGILWGILLGVGSFLTLEFGNSPSPNKKYTRTHGEWHLWIYYCDWRLEEKGKVLAGSGDQHYKIERAIELLEGRTLESVELFSPLWDTIFTFEGQVTLHLFSIHSENCEHWILFTPEGKVLSLGPGDSWSYETDVYS